jgi:hypothetical protein
VLRLRLLCFYAGPDSQADTEPDKVPNKKTNQTPYVQADSVSFCSALSVPNEGTITEPKRFPDQCSHEEPNAVAHIRTHFFPNRSNWPLQ